MNESANDQMMCTDDLFCCWTGLRRDCLGDPGAEMCPLCSLEVIEVKDESEDE